MCNLQAQATCFRTACICGAGFRTDAGKDGIWIDESYVVKDGDDAYVWTLNKKDKLEKTKVELGDYDENLMMYEIKSGLTKDDYIVWASDDLYEGEPAQTWEEYVENGGGEDSVYELILKVGR